MGKTDWNPDHYARFAGLRLQPALDLMFRIGPLPHGEICDLGCGAGAVGPVLAARFGDRQIIGIDTSPAMLLKAQATGAYRAVFEQDAASWQPQQAPALIYSNATLHWLADHHILLPRLAGLLAPGGTLAVQMPHQNRAPSHALWLDLIQRHFPGRFDPETAPGILEAEEYHQILSPLGKFGLWETEYFQVLPAAETGHPVRHFTSSTFARPVLAALNANEADQLIELYDAEIEAAYPQSSDGSVLFPFRRLFFTLDI